MIGKLPGSSTSNRRRVPKDAKSKQTSESADLTRGVTVDRADYRLLEALREDARVPVSELARRAHVSRATAYQRLSRLEATGVIVGYSAHVAARQLGLGITAIILVSVRQTDWRRLAEAAAHFPELEYFATITGSSDGLMIVRVSDMDTLRDVVLDRLQSLPFVRSTQTSFVLEELVHRPFVLPPEPDR